MLNHQLAKSLPQIGLKNIRVLSLWLFPKQSPFQPISQEENQIAISLPPQISARYQHSRGYARQALSDLLGVPPLDIPLQALPGEPPQLGKGWGYISFSHCHDALLIGWSPKKIGVDLERSDRAFAAKSLAKRYFCKADKIDLLQLNGEDLRIAVLQQWLRKEAAIKWQRGRLFKDIKECKFYGHNKYVCIIYNKGP